MTSAGSDGWGGDYSFLLQSIEGRISDNIVNKSIDVSPLSSGIETAKRRRSLEFNSPSSDNHLFSSAKKLRSLAELDELQIQNEQLRDSLERLKNDNQIARDEHIRQIKFLDERCSSLKKESTERLEKYYEEKKKWQSKHRELEQQLKRAQEKGTENNITQTSSATSSAHLHGQNNDIILQKLRSLELDLSAKVAESRENMKHRLEAESQLLEVQVELRQLKGMVGVGSQSDEAVSEARVLRKQLSELESVHKRTAREHESMKLKLKNQTLLEEELSAMKAKLRLTEEKLGAFKLVQEEHQQLKEEKVLWSQLFQDVLTEAERTALLEEVAGDSAQAIRSATAVSPTQVLQLLSVYQSKCGLLLQGQGQLQHSLSELRRQLRESQSLQQAGEQQKAETQARLENLEYQLRTAQQQGRLYDGEVRSLRSLLETYDLEFRIGKPEASQILALKDKLAVDLREQLDTARETALASAAQVHALEKERDDAKALVSSLQSALETAQLSLHTSNIASANLSSHALQEDAVEELRSKTEEALNDLLCFQHATGLDFLPQRTRVLHMPANPSSHVPLPSTVPSVAALRGLQVALQRASAEAVDQEPGMQNRSAASSAHDSREEANNEATQLSSVLPPSAGPSSCCAAVATQLAAQTKLNLRLKEQFKERISSFREAVYLLTGFKVGFPLYLLHFN